METPLMIGVENRTFLKPKGGFKKRMYYICEVAFSSTNVIHRMILYTGFLNKNGSPESYSGLGEFDASSRDGATHYGELYYCRPIILLADYKLGMINEKIEDWEN